MDNKERARIWLEHDPEDCYWSLAGWSKQDQKGMVDELAEFLDAFEKEVSSTALDSICDYAIARRLEYAEIAKPMPFRRISEQGSAKKLAAECRELAYFDVIRAIERIRAGQKP
jgi:hypothetical protein